MIDALKGMRKLTSIALCDVNDVLEYGSMDRLEEETDALVSIRNKLRQILVEVSDALDSTEWSLIGWDHARRYTLDALHILLVCSDCCLEEIQAIRAKENNASSMAKSK